MRSVAGRCVSLVLLALAVSELRGQTSAVTFSGRVTDVHGAPLASVSVTVAGQGLGAITTRDGRYSFSIPRDRISSTPRVVARLPGYTTAGIVDTVAGNTIVGDFMLHEGSPESGLYLLDSAGHPKAPQFSMANDKVARSAGLSSLKDGPHRKGEREIRMWDVVAIAYPSALYRIVNRSGRVTGEQILYVTWHSEEDRKSFRKVSPKRARELCTQFILDSLFTCHARLSKSVDWSDIWKRLERVNVWNVPDQSQSNEPFVQGFDGEFMTVELWDGQRYRSWSYGNASELSDASGVRDVLTLIQ